MLSSTWARLVGGIVASPGPSKDAYQQKEEQRLARFKRSHGQLTQLWGRTSLYRADPDIVELVRDTLERLTSILQEECRTPVPHPCVSFAISSELPATALKVASTVRKDVVLRAAISMFGALIEGEEDLLEDREFARFLMRLTDIKPADELMERSLDIEAAIVELRFEVAAKIRLQHGMLSAWFHPHHSPGPGMDCGGEANLNGSFPEAGAPQRSQFPLLYSLMDYVHHERPIGDFARTGVLYIIETASSVPELERWVVDSDLATLLATGLGALYSQLSRKIVVSYSPEHFPPVLAFSDFQELPPTSDTQSSSSPDFRTHMNTFLSYLMFWQDVLEHCASAEINRTLLDHFEILFLKQVLYPSLLESSDVDGGSSVAALTYLHRILESLQYPRLIRLSLDYLLAIPDGVPENLATEPGSPSALKRRRTMDSVHRASNGEAKPSPTLFNLVDLIMTSLRSDDQSTVAATLKVASVLLRRHHPYTVSPLQRVVAAGPDHPRRTIGAQQQEVLHLLSLSQGIGAIDRFDDLYESYRLDCLDMIEGHWCSLSALSGDGVSMPRRQLPRTNSGVTVSKPSSYIIHPDDSFFRCLIDLLQTFLSNSVEVNLSLTDTVMAMTSCAVIRLEGWLLVDPANYNFHTHTDRRQVEGAVEESTRVGNWTHQDVLSREEEQRLLSLKKAERRPSWALEHVSPLMSTLGDLANALENARSEIPGFDVHFAERRWILGRKDEAIDDQDPPSLPSRFMKLPEELASPMAQRLDIQDDGASLSRTQVYSSRPMSLGPDEVDRDLLQRQVAIKRTLSGSAKNRTAAIALSLGLDDSSPVAQDQDLDPSTRSITVNHLLTNAIILQDFMLELTAMVTVRSSLLDDVSYL